MADELMTPEEFDQSLDDLTFEENRIKRSARKVAMSTAYAAALARIAALEAEREKYLLWLKEESERLTSLNEKLDANNEIIERLLSEAAHS